MEHELALEAHSHAGPAPGRDPYVSKVAITIAVLAVLAAGAGSLETVESSRAITESSGAVLAQDKATDAWNEYQADTLKRHMDDIAAENGSSHFYRDSETERAAGNKAWLQATDAERERDTRLTASAQHEKRADWLTGAATLVEISITLATVALITRRRFFWFTAIGLGTAGTLLLGTAYYV